MNLLQLRKQMPDIFEKIKNDVEKAIGRHRAGLSLGLVDMGMYQGSFIGGMFFPGGTTIVMNRTPLKIITSEQRDEIVWAYTYHIILHEYIHSLGVFDEGACRGITRDVTEKIFDDPTHPAVILARRGIGTYFPNLHLIYAPPDIDPSELEIEYVRGFDRSSQTYYA
jgi:hypothetical protein